MVAKSRNVDPNKTIICGTRYGNVMASRGSVIPLFVDQIIGDKALTVTDPKMTRFMMSLDDAMDLVMYAFINGQNGDIFVQKAPSASIEVLARALMEILENPDHPIDVIGTRHGEKLFEALLSREEMVRLRIWTLITVLCQICVTLIIKNSWRKVNREFLAPRITTPTMPKNR